MSIPVSVEQEISVSSIGNESRPQDIIVKGSMWTVAYSSGRLILKEFEGQLFRINNVELSKQFILTSAKKIDGSLYNDRFWIWLLLNDNSIKLYEIEPLSNDMPIIHRSISLFTDLKYIDFAVNAQPGIKALTLTNSLENLYLSIIDQPLDNTVFMTQQVDWSSTRLDQIAVLNESNLTNNLFLDVASPPNEFTEEYEFFAPENLNVIVIVQPNQVQISWDAKEGAISYILEKALLPDFSDSLVLYSGTNISIIDVILIANTYYYRVKAISIIESAWASTSITLNVPVKPENLVAVLGPLTGEVDLSWDIVPYVDGYTLQQAKLANFSDAITIYDGAINSFADIVNYTTTYYYQVRAYNILGISDWSDPASIFVDVTATATNYKKILTILRNNRHVVKQLRAISIPAVYDDKYFGTYGSPGGGNTSFNVPNAVTLDFDNNIYVCDYENKRIVKLNKVLSYINSIDVSNYVCKPCAIFFDQQSRCLYIAGMRFHTINNLDIYGYLTIMKCSTSFTDIKYSNDLLGYWNRLNRDDLTHKPVSICKGDYVGEIFIAGVRKVIYRTFETDTSFIMAEPLSIRWDEESMVIRGFINHSNGYFYLNTGTKIVKIRIAETCFNVGDSNFISKSLYGLKEDTNGNLLIYNADKRALISIDENLNFANELYVDSGDSINKSFYDVSDFAVNYVGIPIDLYNMLTVKQTDNEFIFWAPFSEDAHSIGYSPNASNESDSSINRLQLNDFIIGEKVDSGCMILLSNPISGNTNSPINNDLRIITDFTIAIWYKWDSDLGTDGWILDCSGPYSSMLETNNTLYGIQTVFPGNIKIIHKYDSGNVESYVTPIIFPRDGQIHLLVVRRNSSLKQYELNLDNGTSFIQSYINDPTGGSNATLAIGGKSSTDVLNPQANGKYYDTYIFNSFLSNSDISIIFDAGSSEASWFNYSNWNSASGSGYVTWVPII
jgi:hypothetical protein